LIFSQSFFYLF